MAPSGSAFTLAGRGLAVHRSLLSRVSMRSTFTFALRKWPWLRSRILVTWITLAQVLQFACD